MRLKSLNTRAACLALLAGTTAAQAQQTVNLLRSTDAPWCDLAAKEFQAAAGIRVLQARKSTGEALAQLRAEAANPKNDVHLWSVRQYAMSGDMVGGFYSRAIGFGWNEELLKKKLRRNITTYTRSGQAQSKNVAKGEVAIGVSFIFNFENERQQGAPFVKWAAPCEGTSYEVGGITLVKGARNADAAKKYCDWLMSPVGQQIGARANSLQVPANKTFAPDLRIPPVDKVRLIRYDFEKYGKAAERKRLIDRWTREVEALPR